MDIPTAEIRLIRVLIIGHAKSKFPGFWLAVKNSGIHHSDWLNFRHFAGYKLKIKIILGLIKGGDQALISILTMLKGWAVVT